MLYYLLKTAHILFAAIFMGSMVYSYYLWRKLPKANNASSLIQSLQIQGIGVLLPLGLLQLLTGFTIINLQQYDPTSLWINVSIGGFFVTILAWLGFIILLIKQKSRRLQFIFLKLAMTTLLIMIFFMANKII